MKPGKNQNAEDPFKDIKSQLSSNARKRNWGEVIRICRQNPDAQKARIRSGDTALHMAIFDGDEDIVKELVKGRIVDKTTLRMQNKLGNTPLHLAAYLGNARMCRWIASQDPELISIRNSNNETPIFRAVVHGRKDAFLCMHHFCKNNEDAYVCYRKNDGRTILHAAISGEHFDLALQIIHLYPKLVIWADEQGTTPLHILASKPYVFKSGSRMRILHTLIYPFIFVKKLVDPSQSPEDDEDDAQSNETSSGLTCLGERIKYRNRAQKANIEDPNGGQELDDKQGQGLHVFPKNYATCVHSIALIFKGIRVLGFGGLIQMEKIIEEKKKHVWSVQIMEKLLRVQYSSPYGYDYGESPDLSSGEHAGQSDAGNRGTTLAKDEICTQVEGEGTVKKDEDKERKKVIISQKSSGVVIQVEDDDEKEKYKLVKKDEDKEKKKVIILQKSSGLVIQVEDNDEKVKYKLENTRNLKESPLLVAAKHGILEMVEKILEVDPVAIHDSNSDQKNVVLLAAENRQPHVYNFLRKQSVSLKETIFYKTDKYGNSALHLTAKLSDTQGWNIPGPALQMQWEVKWYKFVEKSMPHNFFVRYNYKGETAWEIFCKSHGDLVTEAGKWLTTTSQACSVVSVLIATVAFTTCTTVPGGPNQTGAPLLEKEAPFRVFAIGSLVALCFSIASVVMFMIFFTSRYNERDFATNLPIKFLLELTCLLISIVAVLISFCSAHFLVIRDSYKYTAFSLYAATLFPVGLYACWQVPRYVELLVATFRRKPHRIYK